MESLDSTTLLKRIPTLQEPFLREKLKHLGHEYHIQRMAFFGSILGSEHTDDSDVDVLIEFSPGNSIGFLGLSELQMALSDLFGLPVDARTFSELSRYFRDRVAMEALEFYVA